MGFEQPGVSMWRHREGFVDVVHFRVPWVRYWQVEFGRTPRLPGISQPLPWDCDERSFSFPILNQKVQKFAGNEAAQRLILVQLTPQLRDAAASWFGQFETPTSADER